MYAHFEADRTSARLTIFYGRDIWRKFVQHQNGKVSIICGNKGSIGDVFSMSIRGAAVVARDYGNPTAEVLGKIEQWEEFAMHGRITDPDSQRDEEAYARFEDFCKASDQHIFG